MKSTVEQLSPTRVRINVEVPFTELEPDFDRAFKALAQQVRLPGFRPGKAPRKLLEARVGRGAVLEQVVNDALPSRYSEAVTASDVKPLGQPEIEVTKLEDGQELAFTAEVDVRPEITLPEFDALKITVDPIQIDDAEVDAELQSLRARFGTLTGVERAAQEGDFVSIDLSATVDGTEVPEAATEGLSHEVGSGQLIEGLDDAITGLKAGESKVFTTKLAAGEYAGKDAEVTVTVKSVKERELPEADDDFAQLASEFDTIDELKASLTEQVKRVKSVQQAEQIRDKAIEALLEQTEVPLPEKIVQAQIDDTLHNAIHGLDHDEDKFAEQLTEQGSSREEFDADNKSNAEKAVKTQLLMDAVADKLDIQVGQNDLTERLVLMSRQYGIEPQQLIQILQQNNQLPAMFADVRRGLTIAAVVHAATVTDTDGNVIDTTEFFGPAQAEGAEGEAADESAEKGTDAAE
ncbi:trigger factor [Mycolicibacterium fortuitum]|uniref:Trigger factor n=2 Tax=Mycolicibacterium fortuitum TaxID=1766 RepID=A0A378UUH4_MYCFO|nr:trigger factor [Mycolicibacterium fortuitum]AIY47417.1 Cell division trigger factor [Mycobacterium sp. VKM Ac-1817D]CRL78994.1 trigger factor [Mycolicibacter nonchromogenicus]EJZ15832.1 trigger factor [Mycolicibacterium fortuitum subsp. fortuitum DSM 46621 = ATCC 6841 = JCM 6387]MCA4721837.1 trigger factor [Mycolicibacterium fortuitum]MDG5772632.1 trigger factor [Mycolicibacterium fortuitum]